jgi:hypothetical protein
MVQLAIQDNDIDLIFPPHVVPGLKNLRGRIWQELIERIINLDYLAKDRLAFILMMVNLSGCVTCQADSFKAMRGCAQCASLTIKRFRGNEQDLLLKFKESRLDIDQYFQEDRNDSI